MRTFDFNLFVYLLFITMKQGEIIVLTLIEGIDGSVFSCSSIHCSGDSWKHNFSLLFSTNESWTILFLILKVLSLRAQQCSKEGLKRKNMNIKRSRIKDHFHFSTPLICLLCCPFIFFFFLFSLQMLHHNDVCGGFFDDLEREKAFWILQRLQIEK